MMLRYKIIILIFVLFYINNVISYEHQSHILMNDIMEPIDVILIEDSEELLKNSTYTRCKTGYKCPLENGECCKGGEVCCLYGCSYSEKHVTCKPDVMQNSLHQVKKFLQHEVNMRDKMRLWKERNALKSKVQANELKQKAIEEEMHKKEATVNEENTKKRKARVEEKTKKTRGQHFAHRRRMIEAKINEEENKKSPKDIPLKNRCLQYSRGYGGPKFIELGGECYIQGMLLCPNQRTTVAKLPSTCRPPGRLVFDMHFAGGHTTRFDVLSDGEVRYVSGYYISGGDMGHYIPLGGISFTTRNVLLGDNPKVSQVRLPLVRPWVDYGKAGYMGGRFRVIRPTMIPPLCVISGLIRTKDWTAAAMTNPMFNLGPDCRPDKRLSFQVNSDENSMRVDILPNGEGHLVSGKKKAPWVSLAGIQFFRNGTDLIELTNGWFPHDDGFRPPMVTKWENLCVLTGMAKIVGTPSDFIGKVPEYCTPGTNHRQTFSVVGSAAESATSVSVNEGQRIDILTDGTIRRIDGVKGNYVSFDGIKYTVP